MSCNWSFLFPHATAVPNHIGHGCIDDHVVGHVQVGLPLSGVNHREIRARLIASLKIGLDLRPLSGGKAVEFVEHVGETVVHVCPHLLERFGMPDERILEEYRDTVPEHHRV